ncbi:DUF2306 domain-containing protein [Rhizobium sp. CSW-27]|uniref:DUF2306 domain-containing protein n=1 Tax=Rhizobium sp. CSW-27 TaxID=2839985 RepID=UPI001C03A306|nr:DUF2306 domain-containing protein [Rhizobium sp. CSW-27]MBT9372538.1 DUF2306 domain-containing protein [Rhizobium sp. CSW-27]
MTLDPLLEAPLAVQIHVATMLPAAVVGAFLLIWRGRGTPVHRLLGRIWIGVMLISCLSTAFIHELRVWGDFNPIHLLSVLVFVGCLRAVWLVRHGRVAAHRRLVTQMYVGGILIAGGFTLLPYRIMNRVVFEGSSLPQLLALLAAFVLPWLLLFLVQHNVGWRDGTRSKTFS